MPHDIRSPLPRWLFHTAFVIAAAGTRSAAHSQAAPPTPTAATTKASAQPKPGVFALLNTRTDSVRVEVRVGDATSCDANAPLGTRVIAPERVWAIVARRPLCWRLVPAAGAAPAAWQRHTLAPGERVQVTP